MFSHGGASGAALSHLFHIPFPQLCGLLHIDFTAVTVVELADRVGELVYPKLLSSDAHHIAGIEIENVYGNGSEHLEITNDKTFIKNGG